MRKFISLFILCQSIVSAMRLPMDMLSLDQQFKPLNSRKLMPRTDSQLPVLRLRERDQIHHHQDLLRRLTANLG